MKKRILAMTCMLTGCFGIGQLQWAMARRLWHQPLASIGHHRFEAYLPDAGRLATGTQGQQAHAWPLHRGQSKSRSEVMPIAHGKNGTMVALCGFHAVA